MSTRARVEALVLAIALSACGESPVPVALDTPPAPIPPAVARATSPAAPPPALLPSGPSCTQTVLGRTCIEYPPGSDAIEPQTRCGDNFGAWRAEPCDRSGAVYACVYAHPLERGAVRVHYDHEPALDVAASCAAFEGTLVALGAAPPADVGAAAIEVAAPAAAATPAPPPAVAARAQGPRSDGDLVHEWPTARTPLRGPARTHVEGAPDAGTTRYWAGPTAVPDWIPLRKEHLELTILDPIPNGWFALYREPYGARPNGCARSGPRRHMNCEVVAALFMIDETERFAIRLDAHFSRPDRLEVRDARFVDGVVYFNESCREHSRATRGRCSSVIGIDPMSNRVLMRSPPLVSNGELAVFRWYIVVPYGHAGDRTELNLISRVDGVHRIRMAMPAPAERVTIVSSSDTSAELAITLTGRSTPWTVLVGNLAGTDPTMTALP